MGRKKAARMGPCPPCELAAEKSAHARTRMALRIAVKAFNNFKKNAWATDDREWVQADEALKAIAAARRKK